MSTTDDQGGGDEQDRDRDPPPKRASSRGNGHGRRRNDNGVVKLHAPPPLGSRTVFPVHLENLRSSGLADETIQAAGLYSEARPAALTEILHRNYQRSCGAALVIPFHLPGHAEPYAFRIRPTHPRMTKGRGGTAKPIRYDQSSEHSVLVYLPPWARDSGALSDVTQTLYFTEGEKKCLAFDQLRLPCVGLTGVWLYADKEEPANDAPERLHRTIREHVAVAGRSVVICFDADATTNDQVMLAAARLAGVLHAAGAAMVRFVCPPVGGPKGFDDFYAAHGEAAARALLDAAQPIEPISPREPLQRVASVKGMADAPVPRDLRLPVGYRIERDGTLWDITGKRDVRVCRAPIFLARYLEDEEPGVETVFQAGGQWRTVGVRRRAVIDARSAVSELGAAGAPVTSQNAGRVVDWFDELERVNGERLPRVRCVPRTGWHTVEGMRVFVADVPIYPTSAGDDRPEIIVSDRADRKRAFAGLKPAEGLRAHVEALAAAWKADPVCATVIAGALAAPLLEPLQVPNFALHLLGDSSRGKTSMLKIAASVYGDPSNRTWVASWDTTIAAAEWRAQMLNDLPLCFDEIGTAERGAAERMVYTLINGTSRSRSQKDLGQRATGEWRNIIVSTGEHSLSGHATATGAQVRVVELPVLRFGALDAPGVDAMRDACVAQAGAFGRLWLEHLVDVQDWAEYREVYAESLRDLRTAAASSPLHARMAGYWALLMTAETMASGIGLGEADGTTVQQLFASIAAGDEPLQASADRALELVLGWAAQEAWRFPELNRDALGGFDPKQVHGAVFGYRRHDGALLIHPNALATYLLEHGLSAKQVRAEWAQRGWLEIDADKQTAKLIRLARDRVRMVVLRPEILTGE